MNKYINNIVNKTYIKNLLNLIKDLDEKSSKQDIVEAIHDYKDVLQTITKMNSDDILGRLETTAKDIDHIAKNIILDNKELRKGYVNELLDFLHPYLVKNDNENFFMLLSSIVKSISITESFGFRSYEGRGQEESVRFIIDYANKLEVDLIQIKLIVDKANLRQEMKDMFNEVVGDVELRTLDYLFSTIEFKSNKAIIENNILTTVNQISKLIDENDEVLFKIKPVIFNLLELTVNKWDIQEDITEEEFKLYINNLNKIKAYYNEEIELKIKELIDSYKSNLKHMKSFGVSPLLAIKNGALKHNVSFYATIPNAIPLSNSEYDEFCDFLGKDTLSNKDYKRALITICPVNDFDYKINKLKKHYTENEDNIGLSIIIKREGYDRSLNETFEKINTIVANVIDNLADSCENNIKDLDYFSQFKDWAIPFKSLYVNNINSIVMQSSYLSSNLDKVYGWVDSRMLDRVLVEENYVTRKVNFTMLNSLVLKESFIKWLLEDNQLKSGGLMNQVVGSRRLFTRVVKNSVLNTLSDGSENSVINFMLKELLAKNNVSFKEVYLNNKEFKDMFDKKLNIELEEKDSIYYKETLYLANKVEEKTLDALIDKKIKNRSNIMKI